MAACHDDSVSGCERGTPPRPRRKSISTCTVHRDEAGAGRARTPNGPVSGVIVMVQKRTALQAALFSVVLFVAVFGGLALIGPTEAGGYETCVIEESSKLAREGDVIRWDRSLWPPGIRCIYSRPDGPEVSVVKPVTFTQVAFLTLLCGGAGLLAAHLMNGRRSRAHERRPTPMR